MPSLEDRHGGPSRAVRALARALARAGTPADLLTTAEAGRFPAAEPDDAAALRVFARAAPRALGRAPDLARHLARHPYDCLHHHSLWLLSLRYAHAASRRQGTPLVISPRGMMSDWAWHHRRWRKQLAATLIHPGALHDAAGWHATSPEEAADIRRRGFRQPVCVAPNGVDLPDEAALAAARAHWHAHLPALPGRRVALFYSRFHRKKRLRELVELWCSAERGDWLLLIAGLPEEYSVAEIEQWVGAADPGRTVIVADGTNHPAPYAAAEVLLLPSHSENFGLVVAEAQAAGIPALVTDTTPWRSLEAHASGWCEPWADFGDALARALRCDPATLRSMGARGRTWMQQEFSWDRAARLLQQFYAQLLHG